MSENHRVDSPLRALLLQQSWQVLERASSLVAMQKTVDELEQNKANLASRLDDFAAELERQARSTSALNPALLEWLATNHARHIEASQALDERLSSAHAVLSASLDELAKAQIHERHLQDALKDCVKLIHAGVLAKEFQTLGDQWGSRRASEGLE